MKQTLANIHPEAIIDENVIVESFATIGRNVEIGEGSWIGPNAVIMEGARIGKNCKIFPGAVISAIPQDLKFEGEDTTGEIGDNTTIRECVTLNRGTKARGKTTGTVPAEKARIPRRAWCSCRFVRWVSWAMAVAMITSSRYGR